VERELKRRSRGIAPSGVQAKPLWEIRGLAETLVGVKAFCPFSYEIGPKVKDLNETPPLSEADSFAQPRPALSFSQCGGGGARSAHS